MKIIKNNKGLTLIEILITLAVLGIVVSPLMSMFITSQKINNESEMKYRAIQLAQKHLEEIKSMKQLDNSKYPARSGVYGKEFSYSNGYIIDVIIKKGDDFGGSDIDVSEIPENFDIERDIGTYTDSYNIEVGSGVENIKININFPSTGTVNIALNGSTKDVKVYIFNKNKKQNDYTITGSATVIEVQEKSGEPDNKKPDNQLYEIIAEVKKNGKLIDTIKGTTVFKFSPN